MYRRIIIPRPAAELGTLIIDKCVLRLFPRIHHKRPVMDDSRSSPGAS